MKKMIKIIQMTTVMAIALLAIVGFAPFVSAQPQSRVTGGGIVTPGEETQFGISVTGNRGHFTCLMAGLFPGAPGFIPCPGADCIMIVQGKVISLDSISSTSASFSGTARVIMSDAYAAALGAMLGFPEPLPNIVPGLPFSVDVTEGGAGEGTLQLHLTLPTAAGGSITLDVPMSPGTVVHGRIIIVE